jgi:hypothetical protein
MWATHQSSALAIVSIAVNSAFLVVKATNDFGRVAVCRCAIHRCRRQQLHHRPLFSITSSYLTFDTGARHWQNLCHARPGRHYRTKANTGAIKRALSPPTGSRRGSDPSIFAAPSTPRRYRSKPAPSFGSSSSAGCHGDNARGPRPAEFRRIRPSALSQARGVAARAVTSDFDVD